MHDIEPFFRWKEIYDVSEDKKSPYYGKEHDEFFYTNKIYNHLIHPQWDDFGSQTLYLKVLYVDYKQKIMIIELIGEWNDTLHNDIMFLKRNIVDESIENGITKFILMCDNVLNFHGSDNCYYEEWNEDVEYGWICAINTLKHVQEEMEETCINYYLKMGELFNDFFWQKFSPTQVIKIVEEKVKNHYNTNLM